MLEKLNGNFSKTDALEFKKLDKTLPVQRIAEACSGRTSSRSAFLNIAVSAASPHSSKNCSGVLYSYTARRGRYSHTLLVSYVA